MGAREQVMVVEVLQGRQQHVEDQLVPEAVHQIVDGPGRQLLHHLHLQGVVQGEHLSWICTCAFKSAATVQTGKGLLR